VMMILSGLAIWKPTQFQELAWLLGGYDTARLVHFLGMLAIVSFLVVHLSLVLIVPKTLPPMITGHVHTPESLSAAAPLVATRSVR
jgi:thiosulfate reductase cytochrome b subunit